MVCQSTCLAYSASERSIVNSTYCPGPGPTDGSRQARLLKDYVDCTAWTTLATNNTETCVQGIENEGNCGFGTSTAQLCGYCRGDNPDSCCYQGMSFSNSCLVSANVERSTESAVQHGMERNSCSVFERSTRIGYQSKRADEQRMWMHLYAAILCPSGRHRRLRHRQPAARAPRRHPAQRPLISRTEVLVTERL